MKKYKPRQMIMWTNGTEISIIELAEMYGRSPSRIRQLLSTGKSIEEILAKLEKPVRHRSTPVSLPKIEARAATAIDPVLIARLIARTGMNRAQVAKALGVTPQRLNNWLKGDSYIPIQYQDALFTLVDDCEA